MRRSLVEFVGLQGASCFFTPCLQLSVCQSRCMQVRVQHPSNLPGRFVLYCQFRHGCPTSCKVQSTPRFVHREAHLFPVASAWQAWARGIRLCGPSSVSVLQAGCYGISFLLRRTYVCMSWLTAEFLFVRCRVPSQNAIAPGCPAGLREPGASGNLVYVFGCLSGASAWSLVT